MSHTTRTRSLAAALAGALAAAALGGCAAAPDLVHASAARIAEAPPVPASSASTPRLVAPFAVPSPVTREAESAPPAPAAPREVEAPAPATPAAVVEHDIADAQEIVDKARYFVEECARQRAPELLEEIERTLDPVQKRIVHGVRGEKLWALAAHVVDEGTGKIVEEYVVTFRRREGAPGYVMRESFQPLAACAGLPARRRVLVSVTGAPGYARERLGWGTSLPAREERLTTIPVGYASAGTLEGTCVVKTACGPAIEP